MRATIFTEVCFLPPIMAFLGWVAPAAGAAPAPPPAEIKPPKGVVLIHLADETVTFESVKAGETWVIEVKCKSVTVRAPRIFLWHKGQAIEVAAIPNKMKYTAPHGGPYYESGVFTFIKGGFGVGPSKDGGRGRIKPGDVVITHPQLTIEVEKSK